MSKISPLRFFRRKQKEENREFDKRRREFFEEYKELSRKYRCDWQPFIEIDKHGQQAQPRLAITDQTEFYKKEAEEKRKIEEAKKTNEESINKS